MEKIDFVIAWVDGADPKWIDKRNQYTKNAISAHYYRDWELLRYWFRAVEKYASWVHKIYFVTDGQIPKWMNINHPKLKIVNHNEYIPHQYLPTFNANVIELNFHLIEELSEKFVYFNDDMFIGDYVKPDDYFCNGLPKATSVASCIIPREEIFSNILLNNTILLNQIFDKKVVVKRDFKKWYSFEHSWMDNLRNLFFLNLPTHQDFTGIKFDHLPSPMLKSTFNKVWSLFPTVLDQTCTHKFRNREDVNQYLFTNYQMLTGQFYPKNKKFGKGYMLDDNQKVLEQACKDIVDRKHKMFCLNDNSKVDFDLAKEKLIAAFVQLLPVHSQYEIDGEK